MDLLDLILDSSEKPREESEQRWFVELLLLSCLLLGSLLGLVGLRIPLPLHLFLLFFDGNLGPLLLPILLPLDLFLPFLLAGQFFG